MPSSHIDNPAQLIDDPDSTVRWMYKNGVAVTGDVTGDYIRDNWGDVPVREQWDYVKPHEDGTPNLFNDTRSAT